VSMPCSVFHQSKKHVRRLYKQAYTYKPLAFIYDIDKEWSYCEK
jgi:hypothetical protein